MAFTAPYNFGAAAEGEALVFGASRPGALQQRCYTPDLRIEPEEVQEWVAFMKAQGVQRVVSMLSASELDTLPGLQAAMQAAWPEEGAWLNVDVKAVPEAGRARVMTALDAADAAGEKAVVHCWGGGGRTGTVLAAFLVRRRGRSAADAKAAVEAYAAANGISRRPDADAIAQWAGA